MSQGSSVVRHSRSKEQEMRPNLWCSEVSLLQAGSDHHGCAAATSLVRPIPQADLLEPILVLALEDVQGDVGLGHDVAHGGGGVLESSG